MTLTIIGTSHISKYSMKEVEQTILEKKPDIVAVELDRQRLYALFHPHIQQQQRALWKHYGIKAALFLLLARALQKKIGKNIGILPGSEMKKGVEIAAKLQIKIALVDQNIAITAKKLNGVLGFGVFWQILKDGVLGMMKRGDAYKLLGSLDIEKPSQQTITNALIYMKQSFPTLYNLLVEERNQVMFSRVEKFLEQKQSVVLVVGAAHKEGIEMLYTQYKKEKSTKRKSVEVKEN